MTAAEFKQAWESNGDKLVTFPAESVAGLRVPEAHRAFLIEPGMPESAAPFLDFGGKFYFPIPSVADLWKAGEVFRRYRAIGANGFGDPICLDEDAEGVIVYLNHDDEMRRCYMNSNVQCLAYSLLAFRDVVRETVEIGGKDAFLNNKVPHDVVNRFIIRMDEIDPPAIKADTF